MSAPILSILTPAIWSRREKAEKLEADIGWQITKADAIGKVEHLVLFDNKARSVGLKRQALLNAARGKYIAFCDDDDTISDTYVEKLLAAAELNPDCITFRQLSTINGVDGWIEFRGNAERDNPWQPGQTVQRPPWHVCGWKRELVRHCQFTDKMDGEDIDWCRQARLHISNCAHIDAVLHHYRFDSKLTEASGR